MQTNKKSVNATNVLNKAIAKATLYLNLPQKDISEIVGSSRPQISRLIKSGASCINLNTKEGECALLFLRMLRSLEAIVGDDPTQTREWLDNYNHHLGGKPIEMIKNIQGLYEVVIYLDAMRGQG
jgi:hypothetical protein